MKQQLCSLLTHPGANDGLPPVYTRPILRRFSNYVFFIWLGTKIKKITVLALIQMLP